MIEKICCFYNVGTTFDKNDYKELKDVWNYNPRCCKSDLCNGLYCEDYGINFNKKDTIQNIKKYVEIGVNNTYGYMKEVRISLPKDLWDSIYSRLIEDYRFKNIKNAKNNGIIPYEYHEIIEDYSSYWEEPDISFWKDDENIKQNAIHILKESELDNETINWINKNLYNLEEEKVVEENEL